MEFDSELCILLMKIILKSNVMKKLILVFAITMLVSGFLSAREISGTVKDESGNSLPGVLVKTDNSNRNTVTDAMGFYKIQLMPGDKALVFSFIGMETKIVKIGRSYKIDVVLKASKEVNDEIVIKGYAQPQLLHVVTNAVEMKKSATTGIMIRGVGAIAPNWNTENYSTIHENGFKDAKANPLSTFSIDVDNASYSNVRRYINNGELPPRDAVG